MRFPPRLSAPQPRALLWHVASGRSEGPSLDAGSLRTPGRPAPDPSLPWPTVCLHLDQGWR